MPFPHNANYHGEYHPAGGFGGFHIRCIPGAGSLTITARLKITWVADQGPWDGAKQATFRQKLLTKVAASWDSKWRFRCNAAGFGNVVVTPAFVLQIVPNGEHFEFFCHNKHGQAYLNAGNNSVHLFENDVFAIDKAPGAIRTVGMSAGGVMGAEKRKVDQILAPVQNITVSRATGAWAVAPGSTVALNTFATELARVDPHAPKYPLVIEATSGLATKAQEMCDCVETFLNARNVNYPIVKKPIKTSKKFKNIFTHTPKPTGTVSIRVDDSDPTTVRQNWLYRYKVAVHEFGHCLGLPDEYQDHYPALGTQAHDEWRRLCAAANVPDRPVPKFDASMMSCGWQTYACHFVTVWDALCGLTTGVVGPGDWVIERGTQADIL